MDFISSNNTRYELIESLGEGGQGYILKVKDQNNNLFALKLYKDNQNISIQKKIISALIVNKPKVNNKDISFIWPLDTIETKRSRFGYIMPLYDNKRYIHYNKVINQRVIPPTMRQLAYLSFLIVEALHNIHKSGLAYCDINMGNIQFDLQESKIIVCDNDNVVINNTDVNILGVPEFMAPEVALGQQRPNASSDLYSLAILLYMVWFYEHPMEGKKIEEVRCWDLVAKKKFYHESPLFVHDPIDNSNTVEDMPIYQLSYARWKVYATKLMKEEFTKTFTKGIKQPNSRTTTSSWKRLFIEIMSNTFSCSYCGSENIYDPDGELSYCSKCKAEFEKQMHIEIRQPGNRMRLFVDENKKIYPYHLGDYTNMMEQKPIAQIEKHPKKRGAFIIRNLSDNTWNYMIEENNYNIEPKTARALIENASIMMNGIKLKIQKGGR